MKAVSVLLTSFLSIALIACQPSADTPEPESNPESSSHDLAGQLDINSAPVEELTKLPGVGEVMAQRIIDARPFKSVDELIQVKGLGEKTLQDLRPHVKVTSTD